MAGGTGTAHRAVLPDLEPDTDYGYRVGLVDLLGKRYQGAEDLNNDRFVDLADILEIALNWGPCQ